MTTNEIESASEDVSYYRERAEILRQLAEVTRSVATRDELHALAAGYDRLATFVESVASAISDPVMGPLPTEPFTDASHSGRH